MAWGIILRFKAAVNDFYFREFRLYEETYLEQKVFVVTWSLAHISDFPYSLPISTAILASNKGPQQYTGRVRSIDTGSAYA